MELSKGWKIRNTFNIFDLYEYCGKNGEEEKDRDEEDENVGMQPSKYSEE